MRLIFTVIRFVIISSLISVAVAIAAAQPPGDKKSGAARRLAVKEKLIKEAPDDDARFDAATKAAPLAFIAEDYVNAGMYAKDLLRQAKTMEDNWNYGNALHVADLVLGRIALKDGNVDEAKRLLLEAGRTPGSPQLDTFGPDMLFAKEMLEKGENAAVIQYFDLCSKFWKMEDGRLGRWKTSVQKGETPDFGPNLRYVFCETNSCQEQN
jgi:hypothetical protein